MAFINLTPHSVDVYPESAFQNLKQVNPTTWVADSVDGVAIAALPSKGVARIQVKTIAAPAVDGVEMVTTEYGEAEGVPDSLEDGDLLVVSLPMQSMMKASCHRFANRAVAPYKVVRLAENTSTVLGCIGFTY